MFFRLLNHEFGKLFKRNEFNIALTVEFAMVSVIFIVSCSVLYKSYTSQLMSAYQLWIGYDTSQFNFTKYIYFLFFITLPASIAFSDSYLEDKKEGVINFIVSRCNRGLYIFSKGIAVFVSGFIIAFLPLLIHQIMCMTSVPLFSVSEAATGNPAYDRYYLTAFMLKDLHSANPYLLNVVYMIFDGMFGGSIALLSYSFSFFKNVNRYVVIILPTILFYMENFVSQLMGKPNYSIMNYLYITAGIKNMNIDVFLFAIMLTISASIIIIILNNLSGDEV
ncbi:hypothetical protein [Mahella australiensis]|uniref:ABC-2 family transporter protein n=1 Tax=Mahella australiensis (strain DSM 15567 / CIP 107919 / 50-1 BON) TaxID=697281 RepID=F3ZZB3_MAHA5|nr:hypothetical protein [Mahella australiensis]AEE95723.1 hypothetical protein Mahau_0519 [Mahella australiensis 50-1 BON]